MITPSKFIKPDQSILAKSISLLKNGSFQTTIGHLFEENASNFDSIDDFILSIETLWILGKISVDLESGEISHVG
jgi:hypothetical protein